MWYVYILTCADQTYYTGITTDITRRLSEHNSGPKGARYTRSRRPVNLRCYTSVSCRSDALRLENKVKMLSRQEKERLLTADGWCCA